MTECHEGEFGEIHFSPMKAISTKTPEVKKAVEALAIVPTRDRLTVLCRKVYNVMMFHAQQQGVDTPVFRIELRRVAKNIDFTSNNTEVLKEHLRQMVTTKVEWQSPTTGEGARWGVAALIAHAEISTVRGESWLEWSYAPTIKQAILDPERYAKISLEHQAALKTMAGLALYEICARYVDNPGGVTAKQSLSWWRPVLTGDPASKEQGAYLDWKVFNRDVVKKAVAEVNNVTDLQVEQVQYKRGRTVVELQFRVSRKGKHRVPLEKLQPVDLQDVGKAIQAGVPQEKAERMLERHGPQKFRAALKDLEDRVGNKRLEPVRSPDKYLAAVLTAPTTTETVSDAAPRLFPTKEEKAARVSLIERYRESRRSEALSLFSEMAAEEKSDHLKEFELRVVEGNPALKRAWVSKGADGAMGKAFFVSFLADTMWGKGWDSPSDAQLLSFNLSLSR